MQSKVSEMVGASSLTEFGDFDDGDLYEECYKAAARGDTRNFVVEFDSTKAYAAHDLGEQSIKQLLQLEVDDFVYHVLKIKEDAGFVRCCSKTER